MIIVKKPYADNDCSIKAYFHKCINIAINVYISSYVGIMLKAFSDQSYLTLCWHNRRVPSYNITVQHEYRIFTEQTIAS